MLLSLARHAARPNYCSVTLRGPVTAKSSIPQTGQGSTAPTSPSTSESIAAFVEAVKAAPKVTGDGQRGRLVFALDATMSRQPTWDMACQLQGDMFHEAGRIGGLDVQLVYFRGMNECRASRWASDPQRLASIMQKIECQGGYTQIGRVLRHTLAETRERRVQALVYVGDALEEPIDTLSVAAGELGMLGVPIFAFQEGRDATAEYGYRELARLTRGAFGRFDPGAADQLAALLRAVAAYASGGRAALSALSARDGGGARLLLQQMDGR